MPTFSGAPERRLALMCERETDPARVVVGAGELHSALGSLELLALLGAGLHQVKAALLGVALVLAHDLHDAVEIAQALDQHALAARLACDAGGNAVDEDQPADECGRHRPSRRRRPWRRAA